MVYALAVSALVALAEGGALWYLWKRYREAADNAAVASSIVGGLSDQLTHAYGDLTEVRRVLAAQNDLEAKADAKTILDAPDLGAALARINGLQ